MASASINELFGATLLGTYDDDAPWEAVHTLRKLGTREVFDVAASWCKSGDPLKRARGLDVLAQLGKTTDHPVNNFPDETYAIVSEIVQREEELRPLSSAIYALGHLDNRDAVPLIVRLRDHSSAEIRYAVAFALGSFPNDDLAVQTLLPLTNDTDEDVRDWATFGIGVLGDQDSPSIRDALYRCLSDANEDVREEAMVALGKRRDQRMLPLLRQAVSGDEIKVRVAEAASLLLGMEKDPPNWGAEEYRNALDERFPERVST